MTDKQLMQDVYDALCVAFPGRQGVAEWEQNETLRAALRERMAQLARDRQPLALETISDLAMQSGAHDEQLLAFARAIEAAHGIGENN